MDDDKNENASNDDTSSEKIKFLGDKDISIEKAKELESQLKNSIRSTNPPTIKNPPQINPNPNQNQNQNQPENAEESQGDSEYLDQGPSCSKFVTSVNFKQCEQSIFTEELDETPGSAQPKLIESSSSNSDKTSSAPKPILRKEPEGKPDPEVARQIETENAVESNNADPTPASSVRSIGGLVCRICHNAENPERLVSPCLCKGSLSFVHIHCLERWISTSRSTICELCQFQYNTEQTLRYSCLQSLRLWYSRSMSRRALQEDCQMFSLLTLVAFGIIGTLLVGIQYYFVQGRHWGLSSVWTKGWLLFFLFTTLLVYFINIYMILRSQLAPWYRWWQSARDIKLILENRKPFRILPGRRIQRMQRQTVPITPAFQQIPPQAWQGQLTGAVSSRSPAVPWVGKLHLLPAPSTRTAAEII